MNRAGKRLIGQVFWVATVITGLVFAYRATSSADEQTPLHRATLSVWDYVSGAQTVTVRNDPTSRLRPGDPVFLALPQIGTKAVAYRQCGTVIDQSGEGPDRQVQIEWYESSIPVDQCQMFQYHATGRLSEVVATLFPPEKQARIKKRISIAVAQHGETLSRQFVPLVEASLRKSMPIIEQEFQAAVRRHREEIDAATTRLKDELVQERLIPLARKEILPIVRKHGQPPAEKIGREIWDRASLFRFGWRAIYDKTPLPQRDLLRREWGRFVEQDAVPVLEKHMDEIVVAIERSLRDITANPTVRSELAEVADQVASDPKSRALVRKILNETFVDNPRLREVWREVWSSTQAQAAIEIAGDRLEPIVRKIGDDVFGSEEIGIDPDFARVLRSQILRKDRRWIIAWHSGASNDVIERVDEAMPYPMVYVVTEATP